MRVAIEGACWAHRRGFGRHMREVLNALWREDTENEYVMIADAKTLESVEVPSSVSVRIAELKESPFDGAHSGRRRKISDLMALGRLARREECDIFFFPTIYSYFPYWGSGRVVLTIHDVIPELHPETCFPNHRSRFFWRMKTWLALREAARVIAVSEYAAKEIAEVFSLRKDRISVVSEAAASIFADGYGQPLDDELRARAGLEPGEQYFLHVGGFDPHKNLVAMIGAYRRFCDGCPNDAPALLMVGDSDDESFLSDFSEVKSAVEKAGLGNRVRFPGFIPDADLAIVYANALALLIPSLREGFGLPAIEAAAAGTPVIATRNSPLPQVLEGGGLFIDPKDEGALVESMKTILSRPDERRRMGAVARERAMAVSWADSARSLRRCFEEVAAT